MDGRPTIYTMAATLGVHASTVSRALTRPQMVRPEVRARVLAEAERVGYMSNPVARGLITGHTGMIGLLIPDIVNPYFAPVVRAIQQAALRADLKVLLMDSGRDLKVETDLLRQVRGQVDGLILAAPRSAPKKLVEVARDVPLVFVNRRLRGTPAVVVNNSKALAAACDHLVADGHRRIALLRGPRPSWAARQRTSAVCRWAGRTAVELVELRPIEALFEGGVGAAAAVAASGVTAVVAFDDATACGVIAGLAKEGLTVPGDVSVVGCDDVLLARTMTPSLTTITAPYEELGDAAVRLLRGAMDGAPPPSVVQLHGRLVLRGSTGPCKKRAG